MLTILGILLVLINVQSFEIEDCCCTSETIDASNEHVLKDTIAQIRNTVFFRTYQVAMAKSCKHFKDNPMCGMESCTVKECCDQEIPEQWKVSSSAEQLAQGLNELNLEWAFGDAGEVQWKDMDENQWVETAVSSEMAFVDLTLNPDGYTGYKGKEAGKIWQAIFEANCFEDQQCMESRTFYRLISGFRTLTTALVFSHFPDENGIWGPSLPFYRKLLHGKDEFINNLYFGYVFLLRALNKAAPILKNYPIDTGNPQDDFRAKQLFTDMLESDFIKATCTPEFSFDESALFVGDKADLKDKFQNAFRNISTILDCVGCEKCKLHAKLEFHGLGTALKILFTNEKMSETNVHFLERNEVIALFGALAKYYDAIEYVRTMASLVEKAEIKEKEDKQQKMMNEIILHSSIGCIFILILWVVMVTGGRSKKKQN